MRKIKAVVLDFDGVLGNTEELQWKKWNKVLKEYKIRISEQEYWMYYCGKSSATDIPMLLKEKYPQIKESWFELAKRAERQQRRLFKKYAKLMPRTLEVLKFFKKKGLKLMVCSAKNQQELKMKLDAIGLSEWFPKKFRITAEDTGGKPKPLPDMYKRACQLLNIFPENCMAIEDTNAGVSSAKAAGLYTVALPNEWTKMQNFEVADLIVFGGWPAFLKRFKNFFD